MIRLTRADPTPTFNNDIIQHDLVIHGVNRCSSVTNKCTFKVFWKFTVDLYSNLSCPNIKLLREN